MADYTYYRKITVDNTKVAETDSGFAVLLNLTASGSGILTDLKTVANNGDIQNTDAAGGASGAYTVPADLTFRTSADLTQAGASLDFEIEYYDAATGDLIAWVQSGVIVDTDVDIYMVYGNAGVTTSQENVAGTWDTNFKMAHHLTGASVTALDDSTGNAHDWTSEGGDPTYAQVGQIGQAVEFDGGGDFIKLAEATDFDLGDGSAITIEAWVNPDVVVDQYHNILSALQDGDDGWYFNIEPDGKLRFRWEVDGAHGVVGWFSSNEAVAAGSWQYVVFVWDGDLDAGSGDLYVDAVDVSDDGAYSTTGTPAGKTADVDFLWSGMRWGGEHDFDGKICELRFSDTNRSADYITTSYNNQSSPSTFYNVAVEVPTFLQPVGITTGEAFGTPALVIALQPTGIASAETLGTAIVGIWGEDAGTRWGDGAIWGDTTLWGDSPGWGSGKIWGTGVLWGQSLLPYPRGNHINLEIRTGSGTSYTSKAIDTAWRTESVLAQRISRAYFTFRVTSRSAIDDHAEIIVTDQAQRRVFAGFVESFEARPDGVEIEYDVVCVDYSWLLDHPNQLITKVYEDGTSDKDIIQDIMKKYCPEISADAVEEIEGDLTREYYENMTPRQIIDSLCKRTGAAWYVDYGGSGSYKAKLHYFVPTPVWWSTKKFILADGIQLDPPPYPYGDLVKRREHGIATEVIVEGRPNYVEVIEATISIPEEDLDDPDLAARKRIKLPYKLKPLDGEIRPQILAYDGEDYLWLKVGYGGTQDRLGDPEDGFYPVLWFNDDKYLEFFTAPGVDGSNYGVKYSAAELRPTEGVATDETGETKYGRVLRTRVHDETIHDTATAQLVAETLLDRWKANQDTYTCVFWEHGLRAGETVGLVNAALGIRDAFTVQRVVGRGIGGDLWEYELELGKFIPDTVDTLRDLATDKANRDELEKGVGKPPVIGQIMFNIPGTISTVNDTAAIYICAVNNLQILSTQSYAVTAPTGSNMVFKAYRYFSDPDHELYGLWYSIYTIDEEPYIEDGETIGVDGTLSTLAGRPWLREGDMIKLVVDSWGSTTAGADVTVSLKVRQ